MGVRPAQGSQVLYLRATDTPNNFRDMTACAQNGIRTTHALWSETKRKFEVVVGEVATCQPDRRYRVT